MNANKGMVVLCASVCAGAGPDTGPPAAAPFAGHGPAPTSCSRPADLQVPAEMTLFLLVLNVAAAAASGMPWLGVCLMCSATAMIGHSALIAAI